MPGSVVGQFACLQAVRRPARIAEPEVVRIRRLIVMCRDRDDRAAQAVASSVHLGGLRMLCVAAQGITDAGALALAQSPYLGSLSELRAYANRISVAGQEALRNRFGK